MAAVICCVLIVPRAYAAKFHPARGFALSRRPKRRYSTAAESFARLLRSYARLLRACECAHGVRGYVRVRVRARTLKKRHCETGTVSLSLSPSLSLVAFHFGSRAHVGNSISLFASCANCCILHAYEVCSFSLFLARSLLSSLSTCPFLSAYRLVFLTSLLADHFNIFVSCYPMQRRTVQAENRYNTQANDAFFNPMEVKISLCKYNV